MADSGNKRQTQNINPKADINAGHNRSEDVALAKVEASIQHRRTEAMYIINSDGEVVYSNTGAKNSVKFNYTEVAPKAKDAIITHNHPTDNVSSPNTIGKRIGASFSGADLGVAIQTNAKEVRAVTAGGFIFSSKRPKDGWGALSGNDVKNYIDRKYKEYVKKYNKQSIAAITKKLYGKQYKDSNELKLDERTYSDRVYVLSVHKALQDASKRFGFNYTRKRVYDSSF